MNTKGIDLVGVRLGQLTVIRLVGSSRGGSRLWECLCSCGNVVNVSTRHLNRKNNNVRSCGCLKLTSGESHKDWKGCGDISGAWWSARVRRSSSKRADIELTITKEFSWNLFLKQNRRC